MSMVSGSLQSRERSISSGGRIFAKVYGQEKIIGSPVRGGLGFSFRRLRGNSPVSVDCQVALGLAAVPGGPLGPSPAPARGATPDPAGWASEAVRALDVAQALARVAVEGVPLALLALAAGGVGRCSGLCTGARASPHTVSRGWSCRANSVPCPCAPGLRCAACNPWGGRRNGARGGFRWPFVGLLAVKLSPLRFPTGRLRAAPPHVFPAPAVRRGGCRVCAHGHAHSPRLPTDVLPRPAPPPVSRRLAGLRPARSGGAAQSGSAHSSAPRRVCGCV